MNVWRRFAASTYSERRSKDGAARAQYEDSEAWNRNQPQTRSYPQAVRQTQGKRTSRMEKAKKEAGE